MQVTGWYLSPQTYVAYVGADLVVLDVSENAYFCIPQAGDAIHQHGDGRLDFDDADLAEQFATAGLITRTPSQARPTLPPPACADLQAVIADPISPGERAGMIWAFAGMVRNYYGRPFSHLISMARRGACGLDAAIPGPSPVTAQRAAAFAHLLPWTPFQGECLFRSFMLLRFLRLAGQDARWVFAVRTWPFQAHCWLQVGETALDDSADRVAPFTPIFAV